MKFTTSVSPRASHACKVNGAVNGTVNSSFRAPFTMSAAKRAAKIAEGKDVVGVVPFTPRAKAVRLSFDRRERIKDLLARNGSRCIGLPP